MEELHIPLWLESCNSEEEVLKETGSEHGVMYLRMELHTVPGDLGILHGCYWKQVSESGYAVALRYCCNPVTVAHPGLET